MPQGVWIRTDSFSSAVPSQRPSPRAIASATFRLGLFYDKVVHLKTATNWGNATLPALAIAEFLRNGGYDHHLRKIRRTYRDQVQKMREAVATEFPEPVKISNPRGGFVLWVELPPR